MNSKVVWDTCLLCGVVFDQPSNEPLHESCAKAVAKDETLKAVVGLKKDIQGKFAEMGKAIHPEPDREAARELVASVLRDRIDQAQGGQSSTPRPLKPLHLGDSAIPGIKALLGFPEGMRRLDK